MCCGFTTPPSPGRRLSEHAAKGSALIRKADSEARRSHGSRARLDDPTFAPESRPISSPGIRPTSDITVSKRLGQPPFPSEAGRSLRCHDWNVPDSGCYEGNRNENFTLRSADHRCCCLPQPLSGAVRAQRKFWFRKGKAYRSVVSSAHRSAGIGREIRGYPSAERHADLHARRPYVSAAHVPKVRKCSIK